MASDTEEEEVAPLARNGDVDNNADPSNDDAAVAKANVQSTKWIVVPHKKAKSIVWKTCGIVVDKEDETFQGFAVCQQCNEFFKYTMGSATSTLLRHLPKCKPALPNVSANEPATSSSQGDANSPSVFQFKERIKRQSVVVSCAELRPFHMYDGPELRKLFGLYMDAGRAHKNVTVKDLAPSSTTVSRQVDDHADQLRLKVLPEIREAMAAGFASLTTDMWKEDFTKHDYLALTVHFIRKKVWRKVNQVLFCVLFPEELSHSSEHINDVILTECSQIGMSKEDHLSKSRWISDNAANLVKALSEFLRDHCMAHALNIVLSTSVVAKLKDMDLLGILGNVFIQKIRELIDFLVKERLARNFPVKLVTGPVCIPQTQCKTYVPMLSSLESNFTEIEAQMAGNPLLQNVALKDIQDVRSFLQGIENLAVRNKTHGFYVPPLQQPSLADHLAERETDSELMLDIRSHCEAEFGFLEASLLIERCKSLVTYVKLAADHALASSLDQSCEPRWNSNQGMLESVKDNFDKITIFLNNKRQMARMEGITKENLELLIDFLEPFGENIKAVQTDKEPTLHLGALSYIKLRNHCNPLPGDTNMIRSLKARSQFLLDTKWTVTEDHKVALFLMPEFRSLSMLPSLERSQVHEATRERCKEFQRPVQDQSELQPPPAKKRRLFDEWRDKPSAAHTDEVAQYLLEPVPPEEIEALTWWREREHLYPTLSQVARRLLARPVSSAFSEKSFSLAGNIINKQTSKIDPQRVNNVMFVNSAMRNA